MLEHPERLLVLAVFLLSFDWLYHAIPDGNACCGVDLLVELSFLWRFCARFVCRYDWDCPAACEIKEQRRG